MNDLYEVQYRPSSLPLHKSQDLAIHDNSLKSASEHLAHHLNPVLGSKLINLEHIPRLYSNSDIEILYFATYCNCLEPNPNCESGINDEIVVILVS